MENKNIVKLGDLCKKVTYGIRIPEQINGTIPVPMIKSDNITGSNQIDLASIDRKMIRASSAGKVVKAGDILICLRYPEKMAIVPQEAEGYSFSPELLALELDQTVMDPKVVAAYLALPQVAAYLQRKSGILPYEHEEMVKTILNLEIAVPSADKQKHMVELMDLAIEQKTLIASETEILNKLMRTSVARYAGGLSS